MWLRSCADPGIKKKQVTIPMRQQSDVINISNVTYGKVKAIRSSENSRSSLQEACSRRVELSHLVTGYVLYLASDKR